MIVKSRLRCESCIRPVARRLALFQAKDEYECYAESYVKCFWGLCDLHKSEDKLVTKAITQVVTEQPRAQVVPLNSSHLVQDF